MPSKNAAAEAENILAAFWGSDRFPVDPIRIAKMMGVDVKEGVLPDEVSAGLLKKPGHDPVIILEARDSKVRRRFSCAHELGHFVDRFGEDEYEYVDLRGTLAKAGSDPREIFANRFAACLLMPEDAVRKLDKDRTSVWKMAKHFGVSSEAMGYRLQALNLS